MKRHSRNLPILALLLFIGMFILAVASVGAVAQQSATGEALTAAEPTSESRLQSHCEEGQAECEPESSAEDEGEGGVDFGLGELINAERLTDKLQDRVQNSLDRYDLSSSFVGQLMASLAVLLTAVLLAVVGRKALAKALHKLRRSKVGFQISHKRMHFYRQCASVLLTLILICLIAMALVMIWTTEADESLVYLLATSSFRLLLTLAFLATLAAAAFEVVSAVMEFYFTKWSHSGSARVQTLLPIARNVANCVILTLLGITFISELGINIMPLLAGAGVIGFAVGFGAQTFIKDLITGFIIIFEDLVQVGDVVIVGGKGGLVEKITIRKIQLRGLDGVVYTVPYSEITVIENMTKEYSYYLFNIGVAYRESPDEVIDVLKSIGKEMQEDENYKEKILEPIEILGVDGFADSAVMIKARIKTLPIKQWEIGREFNRRMKYRFDELGIEIPFPHQTLYFGQDKQGDAPTAKIELKNSARAANDGADAAG